jgi:hypothetical protein
MRIIIEIIHPTDQQVAVHLYISVCKSKSNSKSKSKERKINKTNYITALRLVARSHKVGRKVDGLPKRYTYNA